MIQNLNKGIAAQGYDVVAFFENKKAIKGKSTITSEFKEGIYYFNSESNKENFELEPQKYVPQYGGFCSIAMSEGAQASPNPKSFLIQDGKLYFFTMMLFGIIDAKRQWVKDPIVKKELADSEWSKLNG